MSEQEILIGAVCSLAGAIVYLYKSQIKGVQKVNKKLDQCEKKHESAQVKMLELSEKVGKLSGYQELHDNIIDKIESLNCTRINHKGKETGKDKGKEVVL